MGCEDMRDRGTEWWGRHEPFHIMLNNYRVSNIVLTNHARSRYLDRIREEDTGEVDINAWLWECLRQNRFKLYSFKNTYLIDDDIVVIIEFTKLEGESSLSGQPLYIMTIVSFLGKISVTHQLRDLSTYYSWLRHSRRIKLVKKRRKRR